MTDTTAQPWWKSAVVYQIYPRSFLDSNGDGIGDLPGLISKLDYLDALGVDVVWVTPFYPSPQHDNGYDIADYRGVDPTFGSLADFDRLIAGLHERGMKFVLDVVLNHTSDEHPWFLESRSSLNSPRRDWFWWRPPRQDVEPGARGAEPTNWLSFFSEPTWTYDEGTNEYYLHLFSRHQPDLNWENPEVRQELYATLRWWLERGVDGFRLDVINMISKELPLTDGPPIGDTGFGDGSDSYITGPRIHEFVNELHQEVIDSVDRVLITVGEMPGVTTHEAALFTDPAREELDMVFQFEHMSVDHGPGGRFDVRPLSLTTLKTSLVRWQQALADRGWNSLYWNNHDQPRVVSRFGSDDPRHRVASAKALGTALHMLQGTPFIYQGEELGMTNYPFQTVEGFRDIETLNYHRLASELGIESDRLLAAMQYTSRDNCRTPMQWDDGPQAGFTTGTPWIAVNPNYPEINAAAQVEDPDSVFHHYRRLIELRHELEVVRTGTFRHLVPGHDQVFAYRRDGHGESLLVVANLSSDPCRAGIEGSAESGQVLLSNYPDPRLPQEELRPWEATVFLTDFQPTG